MIAQKINYGGKEHQLKEPTIEVWARLVGLKDWADEKDFAVMLISEMTGLSKEEVEKTDWESVVTVSNEISNYLLQDSKQFYQEFEFEKKKYKFIDLTNLSFGEFIDIDTFLAKDEIERRKELHILLAMLYREVDDEGKITPHDGTKVQSRSELFKKLPVKYVHGASTFFLRIDEISRGSSHLSLGKRLILMIRMIWILVKLVVFLSIGLGLGRLSNWRKKILQRLKK
jgi:hypothetical protein